MNNLDFKIATIKEKRAKAIASKTSSLSYRYNLEMNPPIAVDEVIEIENQYNIKFPAEYRAFIITIANGGFGPYYGLLSLQDSLKYFHNVKQDNYLNKDLLKIPFPHTFFYNPDEDPYILELGEKCNRGEIPESECSRVYDYLIAGTMVISMEGCGYCRFIVITGPTRGQVWFNADAAAGGGYIPLNLSFLDWYEKWLDEYF